MTLNKEAWDNRTISRLETELQKVPVSLQVLPDLCIHNLGLILVAVKLSFLNLFCVQS